MDTIAAVFSKADTIYVATGSTAPAWAAVCVALVTLAAVFWQATIYNRQADIMKAQETERRRQAIGTFYRVAYDLVDEFRKADSITTGGGPLPVNCETHPRQVLRGASQVFAPLGDKAVMALNHAGRGLDYYFEHVNNWNSLGLANRIIGRVQSVNEARKRVGEALDQAHSEIPEGLRYEWVGKEAHVFTDICSHPSARSA